MHALAETAFQPGGERDARLTELIAQFIHRLERLPPALASLALEQVQLALRVLQAAGMHAEQPDCSPGPRPAEQQPRFVENIDIELRTVIERMRAGIGAEVRVAQLQLNGAREHVRLAETPR